MALINKEIFLYKIKNVFHNTNIYENKNCVNESIVSETLL